MTTQTLASLKQAIADLLTRHGYKCEDNATSIKQAIHCVIELNHVISKVTDEAGGLNLTQREVCSRLHHHLTQHFEQQRENRPRGAYYNTGYYFYDLTNASERHRNDIRTGKANNTFKVPTFRYPDGFDTMNPHDGNNVVAPACSIVDRSFKNPIPRYPQRVQSIEGVAGISGSCALPYENSGATNETSKNNRSVRS